MDKYGLVVMSETGESYPGGQGRMLHALKAAKDFKAAGVDVTLVFHGIGVTWLTAFDQQPDKFTQAYGSLFDEVRDTIGGACHFCAVTRFGAGESAERLGVPLVGDPDDHHTVADLVAEGYTPIVLSAGDRAARSPVTCPGSRSGTEGPDASPIAGQRRRRPILARSTSRDACGRKSPRSGPNRTQTWS